MARWTRKGGGDHEPDPRLAGANDCGGSMSIATKVPAVSQAPAPSSHADDAAVTVIPVLMHWAWSPLGLLILLPLPALFAALTVPDDSYLMLWGQPMFVTGDIKLLAILYSAVILGTFVALHPL